MKYFFLILAFSFLNLSYADVCSPDPAPRFSKYSKPQSNAPKEISFDGQILTRRTFKTEAKEGPFGSYITLDLDLPPFEHLYNPRKIFTSATPHLSC